MTNIEIKREIEKAVVRAVRKALPIGYWIFSDGDMMALRKEPSKFQRKIWGIFGVKYLDSKR